MKDGRTERKDRYQIGFISAGCASFGLLIAWLWSSLYAPRNLTHWQPPPALSPDHPWFNATERAKNALAQLNKEDKLEMIMGVGWQGGNCIGNLRPLPKIGFRGLCLQDAPLGVHGVDNVTAFPSGINVAATFDKKLMFEFGNAMGQEFRSLGINIQLGPAVNLMRAPAAGRNWEGPGGDPYLAAVFADRVVRGIQSNGVVATIKHLIGNEQEHFRDRSSSNIDKKTLMEVYMAPFEAAINAGVGAIMCSYNKLNNIYTCANSDLVNIIVKGTDLDFRGIIITDWYAQYDFMVADLIMPGAWRIPYFYWWQYTPYLSWLLLVGQFFPGYQYIPDNRLDDMVIRILSTYYFFGQDEKDFPIPEFDSFRPLQKNISNFDYAFKKHAKVARDISAASTVVVKNERGLLPLRGVSKLAIIGEDAREPKILNEFMNGNGLDGTLAQGWGSGTTQFPYLVSPFEGISARASGMNISHSFENGDLSLAKKLATVADVALVFGSSDSGEMIMWHVIEGNWGDRNNLKLWHSGDELIEAVASANRNTVVILHTVGPVDMPWFYHPNISAVIYSLLPGQESGNGLADILFGDVNPSGKLPFTVHKCRKDYAADVLYHSFAITPEIQYSEGLYIDYRHADKSGIEPIVPFGFGISYTTFEYSNLKVLTDDSKEFGEINISVLVQNTGNVDGHEVVQLYVSFPEKAREPKKLLKGFEKVWVVSGKTVQVDFKLTKTDLRVWGDDGWANVKGVYQFHCGASSKNNMLLRKNKKWV